MAKKTSKQDKVGDKDIQKRLDDIKKDLQDLRVKIGMAKKSDFSDMSFEVARKLGDTTSDIFKTSSQIVETAIKITQYAALGAVEGGKKAIKESKKPTSKKK